MQLWFSQPREGNAADPVEVQIPSCTSTFLSSFIFIYVNFIISAVVLDGSLAVLPYHVVPNLIYFLIFFSLRNVHFLIKGLAFKLCFPFRLLLIME